MALDISGATFGFRDFDTRGGAFAQFLELRKRFFVDTLAWNIPHDAVLEMDQYDNPTAFYSVALAGGRVVGGARIMRFDAKWGAARCMLSDAAAGSLPDIPRSALPMERCYDAAAECTRLVVCDRLTDGAAREKALATVVAGLVDLAHQLETTELVTLTVPAFTRSLRKLGYDAEQIGERWRSTQDGRNYAVLRMPAEHARLGDKVTHPSSARTRFG